MKISVLLATHNRVRLLERALETIVSQSFDAKEYEIIVVKSACSDGTAELLEKHWSGGCKVLDSSIPGKNVALNLALSVATGSLLVFTDDDISASPQWLSQLYEASVRWPTVGIFGGRIIPAYPDGCPKWIEDSDFKYRGTAFSCFAPGKDERLVSELPFGPNMAIRRDVMKGYRFNEDIGPSGKSYAMGSETELLFRLTNAGQQCVYVPSAIVEHHVAPSQLTREWLIGRAFRSGRGRTRIEPCLDAPQLAGAPRYLWKHLADAQMRRLASMFQGEQQQITAAMDAAAVRGQIYEYRLMRREQRLGQTASLTSEGQTGVAP